MDQSHHCQRSTTSRRGLLKSAIAAATAGNLVSGVPCLAPGLTYAQTADLPGLTVAGYRHDRVTALADGQVGIPGHDVRFETSTIGELNRHVFSGKGTRDISEVGLIPYLLAYCNGGFRDYQLLPIFVLKVFRH